MALATAPMSDVGTGAFPALLLVQGITSRTLALDPLALYRGPQ